MKEITTPGGRRGAAPPPPQTAAAAAGGGGAAAAAAGVGGAAAAEGNRLRLYSFSSANEKISDKAKHIMKISHINVNIYDKAVTSQQK